MKEIAMKAALPFTIIALAAITVAHGQAPSSDAIPVTPDTFIRAETDLYFSAVALKNGGFGKLFFRRDVSPIDQQDVIRQNRDTLYGSGVFDLNAGPVTVTLPDGGKRFVSMQIINQNEYTWPAIYDSQPHTITKEHVGTRYVLLGFRILVDPNDPKDLQQARALQDAIKVEQPGGPGKFQVPKWDPVSQKKIRDALLALATTVNDTSRAFGTKEQVDPVQRLIGAASAWGANPPKDAIYLNVVPTKNDGSTVYKLTVRDVPIDGFWSVSRYNAQGYYEKNALDAYTINNITGKKNADGSVVIQFGGCDGKIPNCLPIEEGWNYMVRLYRPHEEILRGKWKFPEAQPVS
ncbi:MAG: DUF1254 domain-containing protein [Pseudolabrys sp.]